MPERFALISSPETVRAAFAYGDEPAFPPRYNIAPTQPIAIVTAAPHAHGRTRRFGLARWGFLPGFVKDPADFPLLIKARAETLTERPSFRAAVRRRRCLVPADGWYEWLRDGRGAPKRTFLVRRRNCTPMGFAGLMETWIDPYGGEIDTACIVTIAANRLIAPIADPVDRPADRDEGERVLRRRTRRSPTGCPRSSPRPIARRGSTMTASAPSRRSACCVRRRRTRSPS
jgi:putative SOS response-associated peptidase YedK